ncbi:MAG: hypothetical protein CMB20_003355, partial [Methanobacteriota archaeon]
MRKAIGLVLLIVLGTMPLQTSAQISVAAVDLSCANVNDDSDLPLLIINTDSNVTTGNVSCTVTNPNSYAQRIMIQIDIDNLNATSPSSISLGPNAEETFNVTISASQNVTELIEILR